MTDSTGRARQGAGNGRPDRRRTLRQRVSITASERHDLDQVAAAWGVTRAEVCSLCVADSIARWRRRAPQLGPLGLVAAASAAVLLTPLPSASQLRALARVVELAAEADAGG